jgi:TonB-linked SusC/RagA family outer membrane protein
LIRGVGTNGDNNPLIVIDGLQGGDLSTLAPSDIESVQVLKDAASTAIYGTKGANGVIYVTTKKGKVGQVRLNYNASYFTQSAWKVPELLNGEEYIKIINEKYANGGAQLPLGFPLTGTAPAFDTDWLGELFDAGSLNNHNLSISKGTENGSFYASLSYTGQDGIVSPEKSNFDRLTVRVNSETKVNKYLSFGENITIVGTERSSIPENNEFGTPIADALVYDPTTPISDDNAQFGFAQSPFVQKEYVNPFSRIFVNNSQLATQNIFGNVYLEIRPLDKLKFRTDFGVNSYQQILDFYTPAYRLTGSFENQSSDVGNQSYSNFRWQWENYLTYTESIGKHNFEGVVGTTAIQFDDQFFSGTGQDLPIEALDNESLRYIELTPDSSRQAEGIRGPETNNSSIFGRILYNYDEKYLFTASLRRDGSTQFGASNKYAIFPAVSAGWVITNESFFDVPAVNFLKIRSTYGVNGNDRIQSFAYTSLIVFNSTYQFGDGGSQTVLNGATPQNLSNPFVQWEQSRQFDMGIEAKLFENILAVELGYYNKITDGLLLLDNSTPIFAGNGAPIANVGEISNSGFEFKIDYYPTIGDLNLNISLNGSTLKNVVNTVDGQSGFVNGYNWPVRNAAITRMEEGQPLYYFRGYESSGIFKNEAEVFRHINSAGDLLQPGAKPGDLRYEDLNGDGEIDLDDWTNIGKPWADFNFGLNVGGDYKNFDFSFQLVGQFGNEIYRTFERQDVQNNNYTAEWLDRWSEQNPNGAYPRVTTGVTLNNSPSSFYVEDGSFARLRNLQIGYSVPKAIIKRLKMQKARIFVSADNLLTLTKYSGFDPEIGVSGYNVSAAGIDRGFYPQARSYGGGIQLTF